MAARRSTSRRRRPRRSRRGMRLTAPARLDAGRRRRVEVAGSRWPSARAGGCQRPSARLEGGRRADHRRPTARPGPAPSPGTWPRAACSALGCRRPASIAEQEIQYTLDRHQHRPRRQLDARPAAADPERRRAASSTRPARARAEVGAQAGQPRRRDGAASQRLRPRRLRPGQGAGGDAGRQPGPRAAGRALPGRRRRPGVRTARPRPCAQTAPLARRASAAGRR